MPEDEDVDVEWVPPDAEPARPDLVDIDDGDLQEMIEMEFGKKKKNPKPRNRPPDAKLLQDPLWQSWETLLGPALPLETLSIGGLAHSDDLGTFNTAAFKKIASLKSLKKLKLSVSSRADCYGKSATDMFRSASPMLHFLPKTLLCPTIADNLRVLSLYGPDNFGWYSPLDLRRINCQGKSPLNAGLPNLRVLALGGFAFTQTWQIDWIASLGKGYGGSGLEEMYLDNCNVLAEARKVQLQSGQRTIGQDPSGQAIQVDNSEFPDIESIVTRTGIEPREDDEWQEPAVYSTRDRFALVLKVLPEWFTPSASRNLTVLSLHHDELWGYAPKFDFRTIGAATDPGLPQLRTLSLSRFCFSHEWQIDWIASLGKGGLKELFLDDCVLLSVAYCTIASGEATIEPTCIEDIDGNKIQLSNHGYLPDSWQGGNSWDQWSVYYRSNLRWHQFFNHWRKSMSSLMVFRMGSSEAHKIWSHVNLSDYWLDPLPRTTIPLGAHFIFLKENAHNMFHDDAWRENARIAELRVPFYVKYMPEPLDSDNRDLRPWTFLPPMKHEARGSKQADEEDKRQEDDDVMALSMLRHEVQNRSMRWTS
ncbi:hypothetical protein K4K58_000972 [Colletotrichum sp. SAR11_239]|nr:hypothetical protein K4K58_000972 [Colletotrichum sp. SAR11_239]